MTLLSTDPLGLAIDPADGDLLVAPEGVTMVSGLEGVAQLCEVELNIFLGEWFRDQKRGMPWYQEILGEKFNPDLIRLRVTQRLLSVPCVLAVKSVRPTQDAERRVSLSASVSTTFGDTEVGVSRR